MTLAEPYGERWLTPSDQVHQLPRTRCIFRLGSSPAHRLAQPMEIAALIEVVGRGEDNRHQFKADLHNVDGLAAEIVAFSNSGGGTMLIGVNEQGVVVGLSVHDVRRINQLLADATILLVHPPVSVFTENVAHPAGLVIVVSVLDGISKPHMDKNAVIWVKSSADKRRATSREELQRMFQQAGLVHADETPVRGLGSEDVDLSYFDTFFNQRFGMTVNDQSLSLPQLLDNMNLRTQDSLNIAGALLFARSPQFHLPAFIVKAVAYPGTEIDEQRYIDSRDIVGKLSDVFQNTVGFLLANTGTRQNGQSVNSVGVPEVPRIVWEELIANALVHRDYFISAPVRVFVFANRVEIVSPSHLPNNLTIDNIKAGNSNIRNPILASFAANLLPYRGLGSGVLRALRAYPDIEFVDDHEGNLFKLPPTICRRFETAILKPSRH